MPLFLHRYSFQLEANDAGLRLKHLFYGPEFRPLGSSDARRYDVAFVGTLHSDRYRFVKRVLAGFGSAFVYFYSQARWFFLLKRMTDPRLRDVDSADVHFEKLDRASVAAAFRNSLAVLDMQHDQQSGLTMRSFEVLASGAYLVTTNPAASALSRERAIVVSAEPTDHEVADLVDRLRTLPVPTAAPEGFEQHSVDAWVEEFIQLIARGAR
jgi:spore maturation protein CgeB